MGMDITYSGLTCVSGVYMEMCLNGLPSGPLNIPLLPENLFNRSITSVGP